VARTLAEQIEAGAPVELVALLIARDEYPRLDPDACMRALDEMAQPLCSEGTCGIAPGAIPHSRLAEHVYGTLGFRGNEQEYYDPRNSWLNEVIERRLGIPITLTVMLMAIGRRAGIVVEGIAFPGHFLARVGGEGGVYVDPFHGGRVLEPPALARLAERALGQGESLRSEALAPVGTRAIALRMLANLKAIHEQRRDHARALVVCDRMVDLGAPIEARRDRGLHALALGSLATGTSDLEAYLEAKPSAPDAEAIRGALTAAVRRSRSGRPPA
jgi:regulator of sirC expression with transglutaminase-like and TPR domain